MSLQCFETLVLGHVNDTIPDSFAMSVSYRIHTKKLAHLDNKICYARSLFVGRGLGIFNPVVPSMLTSKLPDVSPRANPCKPTDPRDVQRHAETLASHRAAYSAHCYTLYPHVIVTVSAPQLSLKRCTENLRPLQSSTSF